MRGLIFLSAALLSACATAGPKYGDRCEVWSENAKGPGVGGYVPGPCPVVELGDRFCPLPEKDPSNSQRVLNPPELARYKAITSSTSPNPPQIAHVEPVPLSYAATGDASSNKWDRGNPIGDYYTRMSCMELAEITQVLAILHRQDLDTAERRLPNNQTPQSMIMEAFERSLGIKQNVQWGVTPEWSAMLQATQFIEAKLTPDQIRQKLYREVCLGEVDMTYAEPSEFRSPDVVQAQDRSKNRARLRELLVKMHSPRDGYYSKVQN